MVLDVQANPKFLCRKAPRSGPTSADGVISELDRAAACDWGLLPIIWTSGHLGVIRGYLSPSIWRRQVTP